MQLTRNKYSEIVPRLSEIESDQSKRYLKILSGSQSADEALKIYESLKTPERK